MSTMREAVSSAERARISLPRQIGLFALHFVEMCAPMCIGFALGDLVYFSLASVAGYSEPFSELPVLSVLVVMVSMTAPMTAWMLIRGMPGRAVVEMSAACRSSRRRCSRSGAVARCRWKT